MDGLELCGSLAELLPVSKFVIFSGFDDFEYAKQAIRRNVSEYILKPINADELSAVLRRLKAELDREREERRDTERLRIRYTENLPVLQELFYANLLSGRIELGKDQERWISIFPGENGRRLLLTSEAAAMRRCPRCPSKSCWRRP